jgi:hypothetical protein
MTRCTSSWLKPLCCFNSVEEQATTNRGMDSPYGHASGFQDEDPFASDDFGSFVDSLSDDQLLQVKMTNDDNELSELQERVDLVKSKMDALPIDVITDNSSLRLRGGDSDSEDSDVIPHSLKDLPHVTPSERFTSIESLRIEVSDLIKDLMFYHKISGSPFKIGELSLT